MATQDDWAELNKRVKVLIESTRVALEKIDLHIRARRTPLTNPSWRATLSLPTMTLIAHRERVIAQDWLAAKVHDTRRELGLPTHTFQQGYYLSPVAWCAPAEVAYPIQVHDPSQDECYTCKMIRAVHP